LSSSEDIRGKLFATKSVSYKQQHPRI